MPTTLPMTWGSRLGLQALRFAFDRRQQVVDVVALEQPLAQRLERGAPRRRRSSPSCASHRALSSCELALVLVALALDRRARRRQPRRERRAIGTARFAQLANLVELLVEREHLLEQRRRHLHRAVFVRLRRRQSFDGEQMLDARHRDCAASDRRRSGTTSARGWPAARPAARCRSSPDETCGSARGTAARDPPRRGRAGAAGRRSVK